MFSGKSEELIRRIRRAEFAKQSIITFKHHSDNRSTLESVVSHNGNTVKAIPIEHPTEILSHIATHHEVVGIDEVQWFELSIVNVICELINQGKRVIVAGLDLDFRGKPFGCIPILMAVADNVTKLKAICIQCGKDAHYTQRLVNGNAAKFDDPVMLIGAEELYQARCRDCHSIDKTTEF
jgi:thymidine kinase